MNVETRLYGSTALAKVSGRVDSENAMELNDALEAMMDGGATDLVVDCGPLVYISSAGLRALLIAIKRTGSVGGGLALCQVPGHIRDVIDASGFTSLVTIFATPEEALARFAL